MADESNVFTVDQIRMTAIQEAGSIARMLCDPSIKNLIDNADAIASFISSGTLLSAQEA